MYTIYKTINGACFQLNSSIERDNKVSQDTLDELKSLIKEFKENVQDMFPEDRELSNISVEEYSVYTVTSMLTLKKLFAIEELKEYTISFASSILILELVKPNTKNMISLRRTFKNTASKADNKVLHMHALTTALISYYACKSTDISHVTDILWEDITTTIS